MYTKNYYTVTKTELLAGIDRALSDYQVAALTHRHGQPLFDKISHSQDISFSYCPTVLSPKKFFFPPDEVILEYTAAGKITPNIAAQPLILFGLRPCELNALKIMDEAFAECHGDPNYLAKREQSIIVGMECREMCDEHAFCYKVNAQHAPNHFDIMLYDLGDHFAWVAGSEKGERFAKKYFRLHVGDESEVAKFLAEKAESFKDKPPFNKLDQLPTMFEQNKTHPVWEEEGKRCLSCGSCIMVCPTCYCFDVADEWALNLKQGERMRRWDACMLHDFTTVGSGENFRKSPTDRLKHRINRKFNYLMKKHGQAVCVGCGRCVRACLAKISPETIAENIVAEEEEGSQS